MTGTVSEPDDAPPSLADAGLLRTPPVTRRGVRTRASLVAAARVVFERAGYLEARLVDITDEAQCSSGTFYTYFAGKEEILAAVLEVAQDDMMHPGTEHVPDDGDPVAIIEASNRAYLEAYERNAKLMEVLEQVAAVDPNFRRLRRDRADAFIRRNARSIADLQERELADTGVDAFVASLALSGMISRLAFTHFVVEPALGVAPSCSSEQLVHTATRLWANALRLDTPE
ncbi:TetR family transcriptional regulator [Rhodococcus sp. Leaf7]|nr:TetR family transcriptional regulator [Rhodococcus sp. MEB064]KQU02518.1 TetR family transcriptional regulator [Rhodococcus sp. Leaf7]KQU37989.1 TetR family transcriptional regulator [Rhodococcus sp. Leaf247]